MIHGAHAILFSKDADADRRFLRDVLRLRHVDAGHGWLICALPPAEAAVHPADGSERGTRPPTRRPRRRKAKKVGKAQKASKAKKSPPKRRSAPARKSPRARRP